MSSLLSWGPSNSGNKAWYGLAISGNNAIASQANGIDATISFSTDYGLNWQNSDARILLNNEEIEISISNNNAVALYGNGEVYYSINGGKNWTLSTTITQPVNTISISGSRAVISNNSQYFYSTNGGQTYSAGASTPFTSIVLDPENELHGVAVNQNLNQKVYTTTDGGQTWIASSSPTYLYAFSQISNNTLIVSILNEISLIISYDFGATWTNISVPGGARQDPFQFAFNGTSLLCISLQEVLLLTNDFGTTWSETNLTNLGPHAATVALSGLNAIVLNPIAGGDFYPIYISPPPPCFLAETLISLPDGIRKRVDTLKPNDKILSAFPHHNSLTVKHIHKRDVELGKIEQTNLLFKIPASHFGLNCPSEDLYISGHHRIFFQNMSIDGKTTDSIKTFKSQLSFKANRSFKY